VTYAGVTRIFEHRIGFLYLAYLLSSPGRFFHVRELVAYANGLETPGASSGELAEVGLRIGRDHVADDVIDRRAALALRRRLADTERELEVARANNDEGQVARLEDEHSAILAEVRAATRPGGVLRKVPDDSERARKSVGNAIAKAIDTTAAGHPELAAHLEEQIATGTQCIYSPANGETWDVRL
jgi:hypothetical protein